MQTFHVAPQRCPSCQTLCDACTNTTGVGRPSSGDYTVCIACACVLRYAPDMSLLQVPLMAVPASIAPELFRVRAAVQLFQAHQRASMN